MDNAVRTPYSFTEIFKENQDHPNIISEIKFASPSAGVIKENVDPVEIARQYLENGACALSVITAPRYFNGSITYLENIRKQFPQARILMKDFIIDEVQLFQARIVGADAVLLIAGFLSELTLHHLYKISIDLGLTPLVEVHTVEELKIAESMGATLIGVNNRNLRDFKVDLSISVELMKHVTTDAILISESGITTGKEIHFLQQLGYRGFLIGSHFMKYEKPGERLHQILSEVRDAR